MIHDLHRRMARPALPALFCCDTLGHMKQRQRIVISQQQRLALNGSLHASIRLLRGDGAGLTRYLEEQVADNPHLRLIQPQRPILGDWLPRWSGVLQMTSSGLPSVEPGNAAPSLTAHILGAIAALKLDKSATAIAMALTEALEPSGWLGRPLQTIADELGIAIAAAESVLTKLQTLEPTGIFARSLAECLKLQAQDAGQYDGPMAGILANLGLLAAGDTARLARLCNCTEAEVIARFGLIRAMNPKPGSDFLPNSAAALREPDLLARPLKSGRWSVTLNRSGLPDLEVVVKPGNGMAVDRAGLSAARALRFALRARNTTLLRVGREIAGRQLAALIQGPGALLPMTMADVATALSLHESTISRVVAGASLDGPRGVWWLRQMFSGARGGGGGTGPEAAGPQMAAAALRHRIARMIADERPEFPMSDKALTEQLALDTGIIIARRTVAKYRETQGIPPAHRRRRG